MGGKWGHIPYFQNGTVKNMGCVPTNYIKELKKEGFMKSLL